MFRVLSLAAGLMLSLALLFSVAGCGSESEPTTPPPAAETSPAEVPAEAPAEASPGEALVAQKCRMCHTLDRVNDASYDAAGWTTNVERMEKNGLVISADEKAQIIDYLSTR
ncbi:MAG: hypothetical protein U1E26_12075 [Coriobacteriia bacterium]|nr:hypothetical protein [Coriobacteriia bacterium]